MATNDWIQIGGIFVSTVISVISLVKSNSNEKKTDENEKALKRMKEGQIEIQLAQYIHQTEQNIIDIGLKLGNDENILSKVLSSAMELNLNAYEEACAKYIDGKMDKERFKKNYHVSIRRLVESNEYSSYFNPTTSSYKAILKVYNEWNNLEK